MLSLEVPSPLYWEIKKRLIEDASKLKTFNEANITSSYKNIFDQILFQFSGHNKQNLSLYFHL